MTFWIQKYKRSPPLTEFCRHTFSFWTPTLGKRTPEHISAGCTMVKSIFIQIKAQEQLVLCAVIILVPAKLRCLPDTSDEVFPTPVGLISHFHHVQVTHKKHLVRREALQKDLRCDYRQTFWLSHLKQRNRFHHDQCSQLLYSSSPPTKSQTLQQIWPTFSEISQ